ncbi:alpha/beta hydrolase, partial [Streptomyces scabiei]
MRPSLLLLPGMMLDARLYAAQAAALGDEVHLKVCDLTQSETVAGLARHVLATAPDRFALAGLSMGGIVAFEILRQA